MSGSPDIGVRWAGHGSCEVGELALALCLLFDAAMRTRFDLFAKTLLATILRPAAKVETGLEIPGNVQYADLWVEPDANRASALDDCGVLGRMIAQGACLIEVFSSPPGVTDVRACIRKQYTLYHLRTVRARNDGRAVPGFPILWIISHGNPVGAFQGMEMRPLDNWPRGFSVGRMSDPCYLVNVRELPRTPDTVCLRLISRGQLFTDSWNEVTDSGNPSTWPEEAMRRVFLAFWREFHDSSPEEDNMQSFQEMDVAYNEWMRNTLAEGYREGQREGREEGQREGREEGRQEGLIDALELLCGVFNIELSDQQRVGLRTWDVERLQRAIATVHVSRSLPAD